MARDDPRLIFGPPTAGSVTSSEFSRSCSGDISQLSTQRSRRRSCTLLAVQSRCAERRTEPQPLFINPRLLWTLPSCCIRYIECDWGTSTKGAATCTVTIVQQYDVYRNLLPRWAQFTSVLDARRRFAANRTSPRRTSSPSRTSSTQNSQRPSKDTARCSAHRRATIAATAVASQQPPHCEI